MRWLLVLALTACDPAPVTTYQWRVVTLPTGGQGAAVSCHHDLGQCYERAGHACPSGYDVLDRDGHAAVVGEGRAGGYGTAYGAHWSSEYVYSGVLLIRCH